MLKLRLPLTPFFLFACLSWAATQISAATLWYTQPAEDWDEALPLGNGRLAAMVYGGVENERLQLNEESLWAGRPEEAYPENFQENFTRLQDMIFAGEANQAEKFGIENMTKRPTSFRSYEPLGDLEIEFVHSGPASGYRRDLNLIDGLATVNYTVDSVRFQREVLVSAIDDLIAIRLSTTLPGSIEVKVGLSREKDMTVEARENTLIMTGQIIDIAKEDGGREPNSGGSGSPGAHMKFAGQLLARTSGGTITVEADRLHIKNADEVVLLFSAATDYNVEQLNFDRSIDPGLKAKALIEGAANKPWASIKADHLVEHRSIMGRVHLDLGGASLEKVPTDERIRRVQEGKGDPALVKDFFQYGRYLLMSSSRRPGRLPANLQGIWNPYMWAPWESDYHLNINLQMNYWPTDLTNLSETIEPLMDWFEPLTKRAQTPARVLYGSEGWALPHCTNAFGRVTGSGSGRRSQFGNSFIDPLAGAWMAMTLWRQYEFTMDAQFLEEKAYPILKGAAEFLHGYLREDPNGFLVIVPSTSPENRFIDPETGEHTKITHGTTYHNTIVRVVFEAVIDGAETLGVDADLRQRLKADLNRMPPMKIGADGTIQEWIEDFDEADPAHRHVSHLLGLHPFAIITEKDEALFEAAARSLERRGFGGDVGWSNAWKTNFFARLRDAEQAHFYITRLLEKNAMPNLFTGHNERELFQIDGSFGGTAGVAEMLLQSHAGAIELLPALPKAWPTGSVTGLKARGGFVIDIKWNEGQLLEATIHSLAGEPCTIKYAETSQELNLVKGESRTIEP